MLIEVDTSQELGDNFWNVINMSEMTDHLQQLIDFTSLSPEDEAAIEGLPFDNEHLGPIMKQFNEENAREGLRKILEFFKQAPRGWYSKYYRPWAEEQQLLNEKAAERFDRWERRQRRKAVKLLNEDDVKN